MSTCSMQHVLRLIRGCLMKVARPLAEVRSLMKLARTIVYGLDCRQQAIVYCSCSVISACDWILPLPSLSVLSFLVYPYSQNLSNILSYALTILQELVDTKGSSSLISTKVVLLLISFSTGSIQPEIPVDNLDPSLSIIAVPN